MSIRSAFRDWLNRPTKAELAHSVAKADAEWRARVDSEILAISAEIGLIKSLGGGFLGSGAASSPPAPSAASVAERRP